MKKLIVAAGYQQLERALVATARANKPKTGWSPVLLLVPNLWLAQHLKTLLAQETGGFLQTEACTLSDVTDALHNEHQEYNEEYSRLPTFLAHALVQQIMAERSTGRDRFDHSLATDSETVPAVTRDIALCKQTLLSPSDVRQALFTHGDTSDGRFADIWEAYQERLDSAKSWDNEDLLRYSGAWISRSLWLQPFASLWLYGFNGFTPLEKNFLAHLWQHRDTTAFLVSSPHPLYTSARNTCDWLSALGFTLASAAQEPPSWTHALFTSGNSKSETKGFGQDVAGVRIIAAQDEYQEAEAAAAELFRLAQCGVLWHDIAVVWRHEASYVRYLPDMLTSRGIPLDLSAVQLSTTHEGVLLRTIGELFTSRFAREAMVRIINCQALCPENILPPSLWPFAQPSAWHWLAAEMNINHEANAWLRGLEHFLHQQNPALEENHGVPGTIQYSGSWPSVPVTEGGNAEVERQRYWGNLAAALHHFVLFWHKVESDCLSHNSYTGALDSLLAAYQQVCKASPLSDEVAKAVSPIRLADAVRLPWRMETLWQLVSLALDDSVPETTVAGVFAADMEASSGRAYRATLIVGMVQDEFPAVPASNPLLTEQARAEIQRYTQARGREVPMFTRRQCAEQEKLQFHMLLSGSQETVLLWPRNHLLSGQERKPSPFLLESLRAISGEPASASDLGHSACFINAANICGQCFGEPLWQQDTRRLAAAFVNNDMAMLQCLARHHPVFATAAARFATHMHRPTFDCHAGVVRAPQILSLLRQVYSPLQRPRIHARMLETYAVCPFQYFMRYIVKLPVWKEKNSMPNLPMSQQGQIAVAVLSSLAHLPAAEAALKLRQQLASTCANHPMRELYPALLWQIGEEKMAENLEYQLEAMLYHDNEAAPPYCQVAYGETGAPVSLALNQGQSLVFCGHFDQIHLCRNPRRVTGMQYRLVRQLRSRHDDHLAGGESLSLAIDLLALFHLFPPAAGKGSTTGEDHREEYNVCCHYLDEQGNVQKVWFHGASWSRIKEQMRGICQNIIVAIEEGILCPVPAPNKCRICPYIEACGPLREIVFARKQDDPRLASFLEMKEV
jgi:hypothetical protein